LARLPHLTRSIPTSTARSIPSSSQSINSSAKVRLFGARELADPVGSLEVGEHQDVYANGEDLPYVLEYLYDEAFMYVLFVPALCVLVGWLLVRRGRWPSRSELKDSLD